MRTLKSSGVLQRIFNFNAEQQGNPPLIANTYQKEDTVVKISSLRSIFITIVILYFITIIILIGEIVFKKMKFNIK